MKKLSHLYQKLTNVRRQEEPDSSKTEPAMLSPTELLKLADDPTTICGNSLFPDEARAEYQRAFNRAMEYAFSEGLPGDVMEFGTFGGFTARILAELMKKYGAPGSLITFDSFEGFPAATSKADQASLKISGQGYWRENELSTPEGTAKAVQQALGTILPAEKVHVVRGFFRDTMPDAVWRRKAAIVHIDCDLFQASLDVLVGLETFKALQDGTVLLFDDFFCNRANPNFGEHAALQAFLSRYDHYQATPWFTYSWGAAAFFLHDRRVSDQTNTQFVDWGNWQQ